MLLYESVSAKGMMIERNTRNGQMQKGGINQKKNNNKMSQVTITFGERAENSRGMEMIGQYESRGFTVEELLIAQSRFEKQGYKCELVSLNKYLEVESEEAAVLVIRQGVECLLDNSDHSGKELFEEMVKLDWDKKMLNYGKVVNKQARYNLCFGEQAQQPHYQAGRGRIYSWPQVPILAHLRRNLGFYLPKAEEMVAEGNYYYDSSKCGVRFHGDDERKRVIALRLCHGVCTPIHYQWFIYGKPVGKRAIIELNDRDVYVMSEKAVGNDQKRKNIPTLKHATGSEKFTTL